MVGGMSLLLYYIFVDHSSLAHNGMDYQNGAASITSRGPYFAVLVPVIRYLIAQFINRMLIAFFSLGQRSQNSPDLLQRERMQKTHTTQSHPIQSRQSVSSRVLVVATQADHSNSFLYCRHRQLRRENGVTIASSRVTEDRPNRCFTKRRRRRRKWC